MGLKLLAEIGLDGSGFERGMARLGQTAGHNLKNLVAGAFGVYSIHQVLQRTVESADELVTASKRLGVTVEQLQVLRQAAKENNVEFDRLAAAFDRMNVAREKALGGGKIGQKLMESFGKLGITEQMLRSQTAADLFMGPLRSRVIGANPQSIAGPMSAIFGARGFGQIIPLLNTNFEELSGKMHRLGSIMSTDTAVHLKHLADEFGLLSNIIIAQTAPALIDFTEIILKALGKLSSAAAFVGGATSNIRPEQVRKSGLMGVASPLLGFTALLSLLTNQGDVHAGTEAAANVQANWSKMLDDMQQEIKDQADKLKHPIAPVFDEQAAENKQKKMKLDKSDSLLSVGNFLGQSRDAIARLQERQVELLERIADNTDPQLVGSDNMFPI